MANELNPNGKPFEPWAIADKVGKSLQLSDWRSRINREERTHRWVHIFNKIEFDREVVADGTGSLMHITSGSVAPHYIYGLMLALWTYGYARALSDLADEEITLWEGQPIDFPNWDNEVSDPNELEPPDHREEPPSSGGPPVTQPKPPTQPPTQPQLPAPKTEEPKPAPVTGGSNDYSNFE